MQSLSLANAFTTVFSYSAPRTRRAFLYLKGSKVKKSLMVTAVAAACMIATTAADAKGGARGGFSGGRSFSRPSVTRFTPRPATVRPQPKIIRRETKVIHKTEPAATSSGGGFWSNLFGTTAGVVAGSAIYNALTDDKDTQAAPQQSAPVEDKETAK